MVSEGRGGLDLFRRTLRTHRRIVLDTNILIYFLESAPRYDPYVRHIFKEMEKGGLFAVVSVVVELELLVRPLRLGNRQLVQDVMEFTSSFPNLTIVPVSRKIAQRAAQIRALTRVSTPDAIIISTGMEERCDAVVGNGLECARRVTDLPYLCIEEFVRQEKDTAP